MPKQATIALSLILGSAQVLPGADAFSPIDRVLGLGTGGFNSGAMSDYEVDDDSDFAPSSDGDSDLGDQFLLHRQPTRPPIKVRFYSDVYWSDNLASASTAETEGVFWANTIEASWRPKLAENLVLDTFIGQDVYIYEAGFLNFESTRAALGLIYSMPQLGNLSVFGRYEFLYSHANNPSFPVFAANEHLNDHFHRLRFGANRPLFSGPKDSAFIAVDALFDLDADPQSLERFEYSVMLGYTHSFTDKLKFSSFYRAAWADYRNTSREDVNQIIGLELSYALSPSVQVQSSLIYADNNSNSELGFDDYNVLQGGLGVGVTADF